MPCGLALANNQKAGLNPSGCHCVEGLVSDRFATQPAEVIPDQTYRVEVAALVKLSGKMDGSLRAKLHEFNFDTDLARRSLPWKQMGS